MNHSRITEIGGAAARSLAASWSSCLIHPACCLHRSPLHALCAPALDATALPRRPHRCRCLLVGAVAPAHAYSRSPLMALRAPAARTHSSWCRPSPLPQNALIVLALAALCASRGSRSRGLISGWTRGLGWNRWTEGVVGLVGWTCSWAGLLRGVCLGCWV